MAPDLQCKLKSDVRNCGSEESEILTFQISFDCGQQRILVSTDSLEVVHVNSPDVHTSKSSPVHIENLKSFVLYNSLYFNFFLQTF